VGKTELARVLAAELGISFLRYDMSEYAEKHTVAKLIGAPAGYVGYEEGGILTEEIRRHPHAVLLLDEIEKAHPDIFNVLLQVMDYATLTDNQGRKADFRNIILIMTSNAGASRIGKSRIGFGSGPVNTDALMDAVKRTFQPEFRNRLSRIVLFGGMDDRMAEQITDKKLKELSGKLAAKKVDLTITPQAAAYVRNAGITNEYGAREIDRVIAGEVKPLLAELLLFGRLKRGGTCTLLLEDGRLAVH
jgi:ATP-dependent Clp protease ATP-binding subunit ClpA